VEPVPAAAERDFDAVTYASSPRKRGLELVCAAWAEAAPAGARLVVGGVERERGLRWLERRGVPEPAGVEWAGALPHEEWLALVARERVYLNGSRWEEYGIAALEALSAGTPLATVPTPGAFEALPLARALAPDLVAPDSKPASLAGALRAGLALSPADLTDYGRRADELLVPYREDAVRRTIAESVLPALGIEPR
jgi:glycosyltransferase involved in cell wall biosynthesis